MRNRDQSKEGLIRDKAIEIIVKEGFQGLSMQKLATKIGISASTIYIYFENKEDLVNKLFYYADSLYTKAAFENVEVKMDFAEGLWLQWRNNYKYAMEHTNHFLFLEQFRNSPLIKRHPVNDQFFRRLRDEFLDHAVQRKEIENLSFEILWALAYSPLHTILKIHLSSNSSSPSFKLTDENMKQTFLQVLQSLKLR